ncbi:MAG: hypothetical protein SFW66_06370 [Gammaproteobacteria bacterium]|nr:hypothetical protein [Gammaproteobacteria bacterium]
MTKLNDEIITTLDRKNSGYRDVLMEVKEKIFTYYPEEKSPQDNPARIEVARI